MKLGFCNWKATEAEWSEEKLRANLQMIAFQEVRVGYLRINIHLLGCDRPESGKVRVSSFNRLIKLTIHDEITKF